MGELKKGLLMIEVYHNSKFLDYYSKLFENEINEIPANILKKVATVKTETLEAAYCLTNNLDQPWPENTEVIAKEKNLRSTSMGDVLVCEGIAFLVNATGFNRVNIIK